MQTFADTIITSLQNAVVDYIIVVPASGMNAVYDYFDSLHKCIVVTREEEGVALASGMSISNQKVVLLIQQSGVGNLLNAIFTLAEPYELLFSIIVLFRGTEDENPIHHNSSLKTTLVLQQLNSCWVSQKSSEVQQEITKYIHEGQRWICLT